MGRSRSVSDLNNWQQQEQIWHQQEQSQLRGIQSQIFWQGVWRAKQHHDTNNLLQQNQKLQQENNALLEQIRRQLLTPAQRAAEDRQRAAEAAQRAAEAAARAKEAEEQYQLNCKIACVIAWAAVPAILIFNGAWFFAIAYVLASAGVWRLIVQQNKELGLGILSIAILSAFIGLAVAGPHFPSAALSPAGSAVPEPTATPEATPVTSQAEQDASVATHQAVLDDQARIQNNAALAHPAPRAQLIHRRHHH